MKGYDGLLIDNRRGSAERFKESTLGLRTAEILHRPKRRMALF